MAGLKYLPLPAAFGVRADGTKWISLGDPSKPPHMQLDGPPCAKATAEMVRFINAAPAFTDALTSADRERLIALLIRFAACERSGRPAPAAPASPSGRNLLARAITALTGAPSRNGGVS